MTEDFAEEDGELQRTIIKKRLILLVPGDINPIMTIFGDGDGHDGVNVTRYEHDVDNVNDDDFYILN